MFVLRILIAYYSKTGNTEAISNLIEQALEASCEVDKLKIEMVRDYSDLVPHFNPRIILDVLLSRKPRIRSLKDMSPYDLICVGTPNWYGRTAPPIDTFVKEMTNVAGKKAVAFVSSGLGRESYGDDLRKRLEQKGLIVVKTLSLVRREISETHLREIRDSLL